MPQTVPLAKTKERSKDQQVVAPGLVCAQCGLLIADRQIIVCPRCNNSLLPLTGCTGSCFSCKKNCTFTKGS